MLLFSQGVKKHARFLLTSPRISIFKESTDTWYTMAKSLGPLSNHLAQRFWIFHRTLVDGSWRQLLIATHIYERPAIAICPQIPSLAILVAVSLPCWYVLLDFCAQYFIQNLVLAARLDGIQGYWGCRPMCGVKLMNVTTRGTDTRVCGCGGAYYLRGYAPSLGISVEQR